MKSLKSKPSDPPIRIRLTGDNSMQTLAEIQAHFKLKNTNQTVNFCISQFRDIIEFKRELKAKGIFVLNQDTATRFGISIHGGKDDLGL